MCDTRQKATALPNDAYAVHEENYQANCLVTRKGWRCDTTEKAPVIYQNKRILDRTNFDNERNALLAQAPVFRTYATKLFQHNPALMARVTKAAQSPIPGRVVVNFSSVFRYNKQYDLRSFALMQQGIIEAWEQKTANLPILSDYHAYYKEALIELAWIRNRQTN
jgi:hypothetical protein